MPGPSPAHDPTAPDPVIGYCTTCHAQVTQRTALNYPDLPKQHFCSDDCARRFRIIEEERRKRPRVIRTHGSLVGSILRLAFLAAALYFLALLLDHYLGLGFGLPNLLPVALP